MQGGGISKQTGVRRHGGRVLLVDDDAILLSVLARAFSAAGYTVKTAENGRKAIDLIKGYKPALVVTDIVMPEMEGIGAIMAIKQMVHPPKIIAMSGAFGENILHAAELLGANATLRKPLAADTLLQCINRLKQTESADV